MNLSELHSKLIAAARATPPDDRVPYAFEQRIMARITGKTAVDPWGFWSRAFSRAAICCVVLMLVAATSSFFLPVAPLATTASDKTFSQDVEQTLFAAVDNNNADLQDAW